MKRRRVRIIVGLAVAGIVATVVAIGVGRDNAPEPADADAPLLPTPVAPTPPVTQPPQVSVPPPPTPRPNELSRMMAIRGKAVQSPGEALALIEIAEKEFPGGALSEERAATKVNALVRVGRIGAARDAAEDYLQRFPNGPSAQQIERLTGVHPRPPIPDQR